MIKVKDMMTREVISVSPETEITQAAQLLLDKGINGVPVVDRAGKVIGILCQSDLITQQKRVPLPSLFTLLDGIIPLTSMKHFEKEIKKIAATTVVDAMTPDPVTVEPEATLEAVATIMVERGFHTLPVVTEERLVGIVGKKDILRTLIHRSNSG